MTQNQIAFVNYLESARHNKAMEDETHRSNVANETEQKRTHMANEDIANKAADEVIRNNKYTNKLNDAELKEKIRHSKALEGLEGQKLENAVTIAMKQIRSNEKVAKISSEAQKWVAMYKANNDLVLQSKNQKFAAAQNALDRQMKRDFANLENKLKRDISDNTLSTNERIAKAKITLQEWQTNTANDMEKKWRNYQMDFNQDKLALQWYESTLSGLSQLSGLVVGGINKAASAFKGGGGTAKAVKQVTNVGLALKRAGFIT